ncbi:MAG: T9SS type A sorting domain-containing protein [Methanosarcinaceae archaeon]
MKNSILIKLSSLFKTDDEKRSFKLATMLSVLFVFALVIVVGTNAEAQWQGVYFYWDAETHPCDGSELPNPPFWTQEVSHRGHVSCDSTPEGDRFIEWETEEGWGDHYTEIHNTQNLPVTCSAGTTYYLAYFSKFSRINGLDIWHEGSSIQSGDKGLEITGDGIRWVTSRGQWDSYAPNDDHHYTVFLGNPYYHLNEELEHSDVYWQNQNGYSEDNPIQLEYERWYSVIMAIKMASDHTGSATVYINGENILEYNNIQTSSVSSPVITDIKMGGTIAQGPPPDGYDAPPHYRQFDALMLTDSWQDIIDGGYLLDPESPSDITAPASITNLSVSSCSSFSCDLAWTAPGDDDNTGTAAAYDIRYSTANITEDNWGSATQVTGESSPQIAGTSETHTVNGLTSETTYYFAIKTSDEVPNESGLSNIASEATTEPSGNIYFYYDAEDGVVGEELPLASGNPANFCQTECSGSGEKGTIQSSGGAPQGNQYFEWIIADNQSDAYTEISSATTPEGGWGFDVPFGKTLYMAFYQKYILTGDSEYIWYWDLDVCGPNNPLGNCSDKGVELWGYDSNDTRVLRTNVIMGQPYSQPSFPDNDPYKWNMRHAIFYGDNPEIVWGNNRSGYQPYISSYQADYGKWYAVVMKITLSNTGTGEAALWVNGTLIEEYNDINTVLPGTVGDIEIRRIKMNGTIAQPRYEVQQHKRQFDALMLTDSWQNIVDGGYLSEATSVNMIDNSKPFKLAPNPARENTVILISDVHDDFEITIYSINGQKVFHERIQGDNSDFSKELDVSGYPKGIYIVKVRSEELIKAEKLVLE